MVSMSTETAATAVSRNSTIPCAPAANTAAVGVFGHKLSTVVPGTVTGEGVARDLSGIDLALKLHYIRGVYLYESSEVVAGLDTPSLKAPLFTLLDAYYPVCGRIRVGGGATKASACRPFLKCNDCGVRIVEAKSEMKIHHLVDELSGSSAHSRRLVETLEPQQVLGPHLPLSPLLLIQFTRFKCGGLAIGFSWSHILGDAVSVASFFNAWAKLVASGKQLRPKKPEVDLGNNSKEQPSSHAFVDSDHQPAPVSSVKQVDLAGDCWVAPTEQNKHMERLTFHIPDAKLRDLLGKVRNSAAGDFEAICAVIWQCVARIRTKDDRSTITICKPAPATKGSSRPYLGNRQTISTARYTGVRSEQSVANANLIELARLVSGEGARDETQAIGDHVAAYVDGGDDAHQRHHVLYGANLTFVDMGHADCYGLKLKGEAPVLVNYDMFGIGNAGVVVVLPGLPDRDGVKGRGRVVNVTLPADEITGLKQELAKGGFLVIGLGCEEK